MTLEFLLVHFPEQRIVKANDGSVGFSNHLMLLPSDTYHITLDGDGFTPPAHDIQLSGTTAVQPAVVVFSAIATAAGESRAKKS